jgi:amino acid transporter
MPGQATLAKNLTLRDLIVYGLLFIGPTAPMAVFGVVDAKSGGVTALVYLVATIAMGFTAWSYAQMSAAVPKAGSVSAYASAGLGRFPGFVAGWMASLDYLFIPSVAALFMGFALHAILPAIPMWIITGLSILIFTSLNVAGSQVAALAGRIMLIIELVVLSIYVVAAIYMLATTGGHRAWLSPFTGTSGLHLGIVFTAASVAVLSFLGFDAIASFAEENNGDPRGVGRAVLFCLALAGFLFVLQTYLAGVLSTLTPEYLAANPGEQGGAFYTIVSTSIGTWMKTLLSVTKAVGMVFAAMIAQGAASRLLYGMSQQGNMPKWFGEISPRTHTPVRAILVSAGATLALSIWAALKADGLDILSNMVTVGALVAFLLLHVSTYGYFMVKCRSKAWFSHLVIPLIGALIVCVLLVQANQLAQIVAAVWFVIGMIVWFFQRKNPALVQSESRSEVPSEVS